MSGNRLTQTGTTASTYTNSSTSNRVSSISGSLARAYAYDASGNTLSYAGATFTYNNRGRMASASNGGVTATYTYNALGQRIKRTASGVTTLYAYDEAGHLVGEYSSTGALIQETVWLGDTSVATLRPNGSGGVILYYIHADHLNTPRLVTDTANNLRWSWESDPFGTTAPNENPSGLGQFVFNLRFPGQQFDAVAGLNYNYFRDYDSATGRYVESDPAGLNAGVNTFGYAKALPVFLIDPEGLSVSGALTNLRDLWNWMNGEMGNPQYHSNDAITQDLMGTPGWSEIWGQFKASKCAGKRYCSNYQYKQFYTSYSVVGQTIGSFCADLSVAGDVVNVHAFNVWGVESGTRLPEFPGLGSNRGHGSVEQMLHGDASIFQWPKSILENRDSGNFKNARTDFFWTEKNPCCDH